MARPTSPKERERLQEQARIQSKQAEAERAQKKRRLLGIIGLVVVLALVLGTVGAVVANSSSDDETATTASSSATASTSTTALPTGASEIPEVAPGATVTGATPCPAEDGSSPRTTQFAEAPPTCIDPAVDYQAVIHTNVGDITLLLSTAQAPGAVNNFVVLARYHYYDGQSFAPIIQKTLAAMTPKFTGTESSPGYTIPSEVPAQGQVRGPFTVSAIPTDNETGAFDAAFFISTFSNAPDSEVPPTTFGLVLDGTDTIKAIDQAGSADGSPSSAVIITGIEITASVPNT